MIKQLSNIRSKANKKQRPKAPPVTKEETKYRKLCRYFTRVIASSAAGTLLARARRAVKPNETLLCGSNGQLATGIVNEPDVSAAAARDLHRLHVEQHPFVGAERRVEPHGVVER